MEILQPLSCSTMGRLQLNVCFVAVVFPCHRLEWILDSFMEEFLRFKV